MIHSESATVVAVGQKRILHTKLAFSEHSHRSIARKAAASVRKKYKPSRRETASGITRSRTHQARTLAATA